MIRRKNKLRTPENNKAAHETKSMWHDKAGFKAINDTFPSDFLRDVVDVDALVYQVITPNCCSEFHLTTYSFSNLFSILNQMFRCEKM